MAKKNYGDLFGQIPKKEEIADKIEKTKVEAGNAENAEDRTEVKKPESNGNINNVENATKNKNVDTEKKETKRTQTRSNSNESSKFVLKKKEGSTKNTRAFYISDKNYNRLQELSKENGMAISEVLNEILNQVL